MNAQMSRLSFLDVGQCEESRQGKEVEPCWGKPTVPREALADPELLDQRKQAKPVQARERHRPHSPLRPPVGGDNGSKGVTEVRNGSNVPGVTGQGAREEIIFVIDEMGNDHFNGLLGKPVGRGRARRRSLWGSATKAQVPDSGYTSAPNSHGEQLDHCGQYSLRA